MLCLFGLVAMYSGAEHLGGMNLLAASSSVATTGHDEHTPAASTSDDHPTHGAASERQHDSHLMAMCLLVVTTVATVLAWRWRRAALDAEWTPSGVPREFARFGRQPSPTSAWDHDRLCILLR